MKKLYVRVLLKAALEGFFRCGMRFTREWSVVEVDAATAERLQNEQMLEVSETEPDDFEPDVANAADHAAAEAQGATGESGTPAAAVGEAPNDGASAAADSEGAAIQANAEAVAATTAKATKAAKVGK